MKSIRDIKKIYRVVFILLILSVICFYASYAFFTSANEEHGKLNIVAGTLNYKLENSDLLDNKITVAANTIKELTINMTSLNSINSQYEMYYTLAVPNSNVSVGYSINTVDQIIGSINANGNKRISVVIKNNSNSPTTVEFHVVGGLYNNTLVRTEGNSLNMIINTELVFKDTILLKNTLITANPTLTTSSSNTTDANGLYSSTETNNGNPTYYFRGNVTNNYVSFAGFIWRIVRINEDGTVRMIMTDSINNNATYAYNVAANKSNMYYSNSNAKTQLDTWYSSNIGSNASYSSRVATGNYYCEQAKTTDTNSNVSNNGANMIPYTSYTPDFRCEADANGKGIVSSNVGLITYDETVHAGGYFNHTNSNYYLYNNTNYWTMSPAGFTSNYAIDWIVYTGNVTYSYVVTGRSLRPVINLKADTKVIGEGTSSDPYRIKYYTDNTDFNNIILANNTVIENKPTLTTTSASANENGLYISSETNSGNPTFYFRGNINNNYVSFAGQTWRIVRINEDGTVRMIMTTGINNNTKYIFNSNSNNYTYMYYSNSQIKPILDNWYSSTLSSEDNKIANSQYCEQAKVRNTSSFTSGNATMSILDDYTPDFRCVTDANGKGIVSGKIGMITYDEAIYAGGDSSSSNSNYYLKDGSYWTMSPGGLETSSNMAVSWGISNGQLMYTYTSYQPYYTLNPVINLKVDTKVTGTGLVNDKYIIQ